MFLGAGWRLWCSLYSHASPLMRLTCVLVTQLPPNWVYYVLGQFLVIWCMWVGQQLLGCCQDVLDADLVSNWVANFIGTCPLAGWVDAYLLVWVLFHGEQWLYLLSFDNRLDIVWVDLIWYWTLIWGILGIMERMLVAGLWFKPWSLLWLC
jgi:hypothetical protein